MESLGWRWGSRGWGGWAPPLSLIRLSHPLLWSSYRENLFPWKNNKVVVHGSPDKGFMLVAQGDVNTTPRHPIAADVLADLRSRPQVEQPSIHRWGFSFGDCSLMVDYSWRDHQKLKKKVSLICMPTSLGTDCRPHVLQEKTVFCLISYTWLLDYKISFSLSKQPITNEAYDLKKVK